MGMGMVTGIEAGMGIEMGMVMVMHLFVLRRVGISCAAI